jgi:hypothetical protein
MGVHRAAAEDGALWAVGQARAMCSADELGEPGSSDYVRSASGPLGRSVRVTRLVAVYGLLLDVQRLQQLGPVPFIVNVIDEPLPGLIKGYPKKAHAHASHIPACSSLLLGGRPSCVSSRSSQARKGPYRVGCPQTRPSLEK